MYLFVEITPEPDFKLYNLNYPLPVISSGTTVYFYMTADISPSAAINDNLQVDANKYLEI